MSRRASLSVVSDGAIVAHGVTRLSPCATLLSVGRRWGAPSREAHMPKFRGNPDETVTRESRRVRKAATGAYSLRDRSDARNRKPKADKRHG